MQPSFEGLMDAWLAISPSSLLTAVCYTPPIALGPDAANKLIAFDDTKAPLVLG